MFSGPNLFDQIQTNLQTQSASAGIINSNHQLFTTSQPPQQEEDSLFSSLQSPLFNNMGFNAASDVVIPQQDFMNENTINKDMQQQERNNSTTPKQQLIPIQSIQSLNSLGQQQHKPVILQASNKSQSSSTDNSGSLINKKQPISIANAPILKQITHPGEVIPSRCYVYHSIAELASKVEEQQAFFHQMGTLPGSIIDFTITENKTLYLLYQSEIVVIDIQPLLSGDMYAQPQLVDHIGIPGTFTRIDSALNGTYLVLTHKTKASILLINLITNQQSTFSIDNEDQRTIRDIDIYGSLICVLYDKNEIAVFDIISNTRVFKSGFRDPTAQVSRVFYISDIEDDTNCIIDEVTASESNYNHDVSQPFQGYFLLVENQVQKVLKQSSSLHGSAKKESQKAAIKTTFERLYIVKAVNNQQKSSKQLTTQKSNTQDNNQSIVQQDFLKLSEKTAKLVEYDRKRGVIFLMNCDKPQQSITLYSVKLQRPQSNHDSDSDDGKKKNKQTNALDYKFGYIKEMKLLLNNSIIQAINTHNGHRKPRFLRIITKFTNNTLFYYLYIAIGNQVLTFEQDFLDLIPNFDKIREYSEGGFLLDQQHQQPIQQNSQTQIPIIQTNQQNQSLFSNDFFNQMPTTANNTLISQQDPGLIIPSNSTSINNSSNIKSNQQKIQQVPSNMIQAHSDNFNELTHTKQTQQSNQNSQNDDAAILDPEIQRTHEYLEKFLNLGSFSQDNNNKTDQDYQQKDIIDEEMNLQQQQVKMELEKAIENVLKDDIILKDNPLNLHISDHDEIVDKAIVSNQISDPVIQSEPKLVLKQSGEDAKKAGSVEEVSNQKGIIPYTTVAGTTQKKKKSKKKDKNGGANANTTQANSQQQQQQQQQQTQISQTSNVLKDAQQILGQQSNTNSNNNQQNTSPTITSTGGLAQQQIRPQILQNPNSINLQKEQQQQQQQQQTCSTTQNILQPQIMQPSQNPTINNQPIHNQSTNSQSQNQNQNMIQNQSGKKPQKNSQDLMIENYKELTRKYQELAQKLSQMQRQVQNQSNQQIEIDKSIQKNIKTCLPGIIEQALKEMVVPIVSQNMKNIDTQVKETIMPQVENQIVELFTTLQQKENAKQKSSNNQVQKNQVSQATTISESKIKEVINQQFTVAMDTQIKPMLEEQMKQVVEQTQQSLLFANLQFENKLKQEEARNKQIVKYYQAKMEQLLEQQQRAAPLNISQQHAYPRYAVQPPMYPPPYSHYPPYHMPPQPYPGYLPHDQAFIQPPPGLQPLDQRSQSYSNNAQYMNYPPHLLSQPLAQQQMPILPKTMVPESKVSNKLIDFSDDEEDDVNEFKPLHVKNTKLLENSDGDQNDVNDLDEATKKKQLEYREMLKKAQLSNTTKQQKESVNNSSSIRPVMTNIITSTGQQMLMFNEDDITPLPGTSTNKLFSKDSSFQGSNLFMQGKQQALQNSSSKNKQSSKIVAQQQQNSNNPTPTQQTTQKSAKGSKLKSEYEHILTYFKSVANGQPKQLDQLFTHNNPFLLEIKQFLINNIHELNLLHANIITQFMKKIYDRAKMEDASKEFIKEGYAIYRLINSKICKHREDMKLTLPKINEMEKAIGELIQ